MKPERDESTPEKRAYWAALEAVAADAANGHLKKMLRRAEVAREFLLARRLPTPSGGLPSLDQLDRTMK